MKFMEVERLYDLGYEENVNNNIFQDTGAILLEDDDDLENTLKGFAYYLDSEFYFSIVFYDNYYQLIYPMLTGAKAPSSRRELSTRKAMDLFD